MHGYEDTFNYTRACAKDFNSGSVECGPYSPWTNSQSGARGIDTSAWSIGSWFPFLYNLIGPRGSLYGYYMSD